MRRIACALALLTAALLSAAPAHAWVPAATYAVPDDGVATCLRDAGAGRFGLLGPLGRTTTAIDVLQLGDGGLTPASTTTLGWLTSCPAVAGAIGGGVALGGSARADLAPTSFDERMQAAESGAAPQPLGGRAPRFPGTALAVNASGAAVLAWTDQPSIDDFGSGRLLVALRRAGSTSFSAPVVLDRQLPRFVFNPKVVAGIDSAGRATVAWVGGPGLNPDVVVATTDARGAFSVRQKLPCCLISDLALSVNPDGRALLATLSGPPQLYERRPGEATFSPLHRLAGDSAVSPMQVALALGPDGEAIVASRGDNGRVSYATRPAGGAFGPLRDLTHPPAPEGGYGEAGFAILAYGGRPGVPQDDGTAGQLSAAIHGDQAAVGWRDTSPGVSSRAYASFGTVSGGLGRPEALGSPCRPADAVLATVLADGTVAVAWTDNGRTRTALETDTPSGGGRLTVAHGGAAPPATPAPQVRAAVVRPGPLHVRGPMRLRIRCLHAPCDVRVRAKARLVGSPWWSPPRQKDLPPEILQQEEQEKGRLRTPVGVTRPIAAGVTATVRLVPIPAETFVLPKARARGRITVLACSPDGRKTASVTLRPWLRGAALRPMPRIVRATATRHGRRVVVRVRTDRRLHGLASAIARPTSTGRGAYDSLPGRGRRRLTLVVSGTAVRRVTIQLMNADGLLGPPRTVTVR